MDQLQELVNTLAEDDKREFRVFINRQKSKKQRKDLDLFELVSEQTDTKTIQQKLYKIPNKVAYHTLRKRLLKHLTDFIVLKEIDDDPTATSSISGLISLSAYLFKNRSDELAWRFLMKAEQTAIENEQYDLLNNIYHLQINRSDTESATDINTIYKKWEANKILVNENEKINIAYNFIKKELNEIKIKGENKDLEKVVQNLLKKYGLTDIVFKRPEVLYKVLDLTRRVMLFRKDFYSFEPYIIKTYKELIANHGFSKKNHFYKIHILYMIAHILYRNRKFENSNVYLVQMHDSMKEYNKTYYRQFYSKYIMLSAANYAYLNQNNRSIDILSGVSESTLKNLPIEDQLNIKMNLTIFYGYNSEFKKSNLIIQTLNHSDNWLIKKMGIEWVFKKNLIEIMIQYELENYEIALNWIRAFERNFSDLVNHPLYSRVFKFTGTIKNIIHKPELLKDKNFIEHVKTTLVKTPSEQEDLQAMAFYSWLKSKLLGQNYYEVLLNVANTRYEE